MNPLLRWLTSPEWAHVVTALLHSLWQGAIVALVLAVLMRRLTNPLTRYRCALSALGVIGIASIVTWSVLNAPNSAPQPTTATVIEPIAPAITADAFDSNPTGKVVVIGQMTRPEAQTNWTTWLALTWMAGAVIMLLRAGVKVAGAEKLRRSCQPLADQHIALLVAEACRAVGLARRIRVAVTDKLTSPAVVGVLVPTLILPLSLFTTLTPTQIQFVLLHELAHIRRGDYLANLFQLFAEALLFFNPAVWWISHQIRREREACCDALAIELSGAPADYARTLVRVAENIMQPAPAAAPAFGDDGREPSSLADRVQRLLVPGYRPALRLTWRAMATSLLVGVTLLVLSAVGTRNTVGAILSSTQLATNASPLLQSTAPSGASEQKRELHSGESGAEAPMIVDRPNLTQTESNQPLSDTNKPAHEIIASGDFIVVTFAGLVAPPLAHQEPVKPDGSILMPLIGRVVAAGKSVGQLQTEIHDAYVPQYYKRLTITVKVETNTISRFEPQNRGAAVAVKEFAKFGGNYVTTDEIEFNPQTQEMAMKTELERQFNDLTVLSNQVSKLKEDLTVARRLEWIRKGLTAQGSESSHANNFETPTSVTVTNNSREPLYVRAFEVSPKFLHENIITNLSEYEIGQLPAHTNHAVIAFATLRAWIQQMGVELDPALGKSLYYKDRKGMLQIRATMSELDSIENALRDQLPTAPQIASRTFQLEPTTIAKAIETQFPQFKPVTATNVTAGLRALLESTGADLSPPKSIFYNDRAGGIFVRARPQELDAIEELLQVIGRQPPQVNIKAVFVEIPFGKAQPKELAKILGPITEANGTNFTGILTAPQFKAILRAVEANANTKILAMPQITTLSGRQAQIQVSDVKTIVSGMTAAVTNGMTNFVYQSQAMPFGPVLDVLPTVSSDGYTIQMTLSPTFTEFLGYEDAKKLKLSSPDDKGTLPLPVFRTRQMTTSASVWDGQTIVLGNFSDQMLDAPPDLKGAPKASAKRQSKQILVFVTPTIIDPAGNRLNSAK